MSFSSMENRFLYLVRKSKISEVDQYLKDGDVRFKNNPDLSAYTVMITIQNQDAEMMDFLLSNGADVASHPTEKQGGHLHQTIFTHDEKLLRTLLKHHPPLHIKDSSGRTAMGCLLEDEKLAHRFSITPTFLKILLEAGSDPDQTLPDGHTILTYACRHQQQDIAGIILQYPCDIKQQDDAGQTALHYLVQNKHFPADLVQHMIERGLDPETQNNKGQTVIDIVPQEHRASFDKIWQQFAKNRRQNLIQKMPKHRQAMRLKRRSKGPAI